MHPDVTCGRPGFRSVIEEGVQFKRQGFESQLLFFTCCVNLGKTLYLAKPHLPPLKRGWMITYDSVVMINMIFMLFF